MAASMEAIIAIMLKSAVGGMGLFRALEMTLLFFSTEKKIEHKDLH